MTRSSESRGSDYRDCLLIGVVVVLLYSLGFNYYVAPINGDDIVYYEGAVSLSEGNGFKSQGLWIQDWPPVQSMLVAGAMYLTGNREFYISKLVNLVAVLVSLLLAHRLMVREQRRLPTLSCLLIAISPTSLLNGTAGQADFTFFALSMMFFLLVNRLERSRGWWDAVLVGLALGCAALTRWQGVFLGVALIFQAGKLWLSDKRITVSREALSSVIGASIFLGWKYWLHLCIQAGTAATSNYDFQGSSIWWHPAPLELGAEILNVFTQFENVLNVVYPNGGWLVALGAIVFWGILTHGCFLRLKGYGVRATDVYVFVALMMHLIYAYKEARYGVPIAPFMLDYLFTSLATLVQSQRVRRFAVTVWILGLLAIDGVLLFYGDGRRMGPRSQLMLTDERSYLRGYFIDLYDTCLDVSQNAPNAVLAADKYHTRIVRHYSGMETHFPGYDPEVDYDFFIEVTDFAFSSNVPEVMQAELEFPPSLEGRLSDPRQRGKVILWRVDESVEED